MEYIYYSYIQLFRAAVVTGAATATTAAVVATTATTATVVRKNLNVCICQFQQ